MPGSYSSSSRTVPEALGQSDAFIDFQEQISRVAPVNRPVLILGERGTGKELAASRIHYLSNRWERPLVTLNCAALTPALIGSELFGYEKGAFTGATARTQGRFEKASSGTLFLDEIGTIPMEVQEKILRVVEYGVFERVGSSRPVEVDVRIVTATNADLPAMARAGLFKLDLLDRLSFEVIYVPPLRFRKGDIPLLADHFAARMAFEMAWNDIPSFSESAMKALESYAWPGNIRELKNVVERAVYKSGQQRIDTIDFEPFASPYGQNLARPAALADAGRPGKRPAEESDTPLETPADLKRAVARFEAGLVRQALEKCRFNQRKAARFLGLTYDQLRGLKRKHGI